MIEWLFALVLGFGVVATLCGALFQEDALNSIILKSILIMIFLAAFGFTVTEYGGVRQTLIALTLRSFTQHFYFLIIGGVLAIIWTLFREGAFHDLWSTISPHTAPTEFAKAGQRSDFTSLRREKLGSTLVGSSTEYLTTHIDLRTQTLIKLAYYAFSDHSGRTLSLLEAALGAAQGKRQREVQSIIAGIHGRPNLRKTVHPYWRAINGNHATARMLFTELCRLAQHTHNTDGKTVERLTEIGQKLRLDQRDIMIAVQPLR